MPTWGEILVEINQTGQLLLLAQGHPNLSPFDVVRRKYLGLVAAQTGRSTILYSTRTYLPMARDGVFFKSLAVVHPKWRTPAACILAQGAWTVLLTISGTYEDLYTYVVVVLFLFHAATGIAVFVLRFKKPEWPRPYKVTGYPLVPAVFVLTSLFFVLNSLVERPTESLLGFGILLLGVPAYFYWRWKASPAS